MTVTHPAYERFRAIDDVVSVLLCANPGLMELDGTNSYVLRGGPGEPAVVVDAGPKKPKAHLRRLGRVPGVELVLTTHRHGDHTGGVRRLSERLPGVAFRAWSAEFCVGAPPLTDGERIEVGSLTIEVLHTPGHTGDSVSLMVTTSDGRRRLLTGDTILGRGTTVLDPTDGTLRDYLGSLDRIIKRAESPGDGVESTGAGARPITLLPAHGPDHPDVLPVARAYRTHRLDRLAQIERALDELGVTAEQARPKKIVEHVYADVDRSLWPAAKMSVRTQLAYLRR